MKINNILLLINLLSILFISLYNFESINFLRLYRYDDKIHFIIYFIFSIIVLYKVNKENLFYHLPKVLLMLLVPIVTEFMQKYTQRTPDITDLYYDYIGLTAGLFIIIIYKYAKRD